MNSTEQRPYAIDITVESRPGSAGYGCEVLTVWAYSAEDAVYQAGIQLSRQRRRFLVDGVRPSPQSGESNG